MGGLRAVPELFFRLSARTSAGGFGRTLGLALAADGGAVELRSLGDAESVVAIDAPAWLCDAEGIRPSGLVALFDEVSSYAGAAIWDPQCRPGVSVNLSAVLSDDADLKRVGPGSRLVVKSRKQRLGRTLGFIDVDVGVEAGGRTVRLLRGRHTKFMPGTGLRPEALSAPGPWRPWLLGAAHWYLGCMPVLAEARAPRGIGDVFPSPAPGEYLLSAAHANPLGAFHGGAAVILACDAADRLVAERGAGPRRRVRTISANLLAGIPLGAETRVRVDATADSAVGGECGARGLGVGSVVATISRLGSAAAAAGASGGQRGDSLAARAADGAGASAPSLAVECTVTYA